MIGIQNPKDLTIIIDGMKVDLTDPKINICNDPKIMDGPVKLRLDSNHDGGLRIHASLGHQMTWKPIFGVELKK